MTRGEPTLQAGLDQAANVILESIRTDRPRCGPMFHRGYEEDRGFALRFLHIRMDHLVSRTNEILTVVVW